MQEVLIVSIVFGSIVTVIKMGIDASTRNKLIEKGLVDERIRQLFNNQSELSILSNLKWGMILVGVGSAFIAWEYLDWRWSGEGLFGMVLLLAGIGFLVYYPLAQRRLKEIEERQKQNLPPQS